MKNKTNDFYNEGLTPEEIQAQAFLFFLAGYDTTSSTLAFLLYSLAVNQECQDKVYQEVTEVIKDYVSTQNRTFCCKNKKNSL